MVTRKAQIVRALIHFPVGLLQGFATSVSWAAALTFCLAFLTYEVIEDWRISDKSYNDIFGYLLGLGTFIILRLLGLCE